MNCAYIVPEDQKENDTFAHLNSVPVPIYLKANGDRKRRDPYSSLFVSSYSVTEEGEAMRTAASFFDQNRIIFAHVPFAPPQFNRSPEFPCFWYRFLYFPA